MTRLRDAVEIAARIGGRRPPRLRLPTRLLRVMAPLGRLGRPAEPARGHLGVGRRDLLGDPRQGDRELGFAPREIDQGLRDTFGAA